MNPRLCVILKEQIESMSHRREKDVEQKQNIYNKYCSEKKNRKAQQRILKEIVIEIRERVSYGQSPRLKLILESYRRSYNTLWIAYCK